MKLKVLESYFWTQVKEGLSDAKTQLNRIENSAGTGISDVNACRDGVEVWIELKTAHGKWFHFRNAQRAWIYRRIQVGGRVWVLARDDNKLLLYRAIDIINHAEYKVGSDKKSFAIAIDSLTPVYWCMKPFHWADVRDYVFGIRE